MKPQWRPFAPYALILSGIALLTAVGFAVIDRSFSLGVQISLGVVVLGLALAILLDPNRARELLTGRQARYGSNAFLMFIAFLGILIVLNFLAFRHSPNWDLTEDKIHTLAPETVDLLESLDQPVHALAFYTARLNAENTRIMLESFKNGSDGKFTYEFIDPEANPVAAEGITRDGTIVFTMGTNRESVTYASETEFASAILRLANPGERVVYFLTGHGEYDPNEASENSYSMLKSTLISKNYQVELLNLQASPTIPENALAVIIAGPQVPVTQPEVALLKTFIENGGGGIYLSEPPALFPQTDGQADPLADYLTESFGILFGNNIVIDPNIDPPLIAISAGYGEHPTTEKLNRVNTLFPTARSVSLVPSDEALTATSLVTTGANAWGEADITSIESNQVSFDSATDLSGPVDLGVAYEDAMSGGRLVVIGDSDFASNTYFAQLGNGDFAVNVIDWVSEQDNMINLTPKNNTQRVLVPPSNLTMGMLLLGLVCVLPGAVVFLGVFAWINRRKRG